jgi:hypothetical protein
MTTIHKPFLILVTAWIILVFPLMVFGGDVKATGKRLDTSPHPDLSLAQSWGIELSTDDELDTLVFDDGEPSNAYYWAPGYRMAARLSPDTAYSECKVLAIAFYHWTPGAFQPGIFSWNGTNPDTALLLWDDTSTVSGFNVFELDTTNQLVIEGDFVVSHGCVDTITSLGFDPLNNTRAWDYYPSDSTWLSYIETYFIRALVMYPPYVNVPPNVELLTPESFTLESPYPNPFNPTTNIVIHHHHAGPMSLKIYDMLGREVAALVDGFTPGGTIEVTWEANRIPSGMYWVVAEDQSHQAVRKICFLK